MSVRARHLAMVLALLLAVATPLAVSAATNPSPPGYRVKSGDTITSIAVQLRLKGGWRQLYAANRESIGGDPNRLEVGMVLEIPQGAAVPAGQGYVVRSGDTLNSIARRMKVAGGGAALYEANRAAIGSDPNRLEVGQTLLPPGATIPSAAAAPSAPAPAPASSTPPAAALDRPAREAPLAQAAGGVAARPDSGGHATLWSALTALVALLLLMVLGLPRWRRHRREQIWVGGGYSRDHQPTPETTSRPRSVAARTPVGDAAEPGPSEPDSSVVAFRPSSAPGSRRSIHTQDPVAAPQGGGSVGTLQAERRPSRDGRRVKQQPDLTDELLGEVRLVDPSTPLTKGRGPAS